MSLTLLLALPGCAHTPLRKFPRNSPQTDVESSQPVPVPRGLPLLDSDAAQASSLLLGKVPPTTQAIERTIERFFFALAQGKVDALLPLFTPGALRVDSRGNETSLGSYWTQRLEQFDYRLTARVSPVWRSDIVVVPHDDDRATPVVALLKPKTEDVLVLVPISKPEYDGQQYFFDTMWFQLREDNHGLRIVACAEDLD